MLLATKSSKQDHTRILFCAEYLFERGIIYSSSMQKEIIKIFYLIFLSSKILFDVTGCDIFGERTKH